MTRTRLSIAMLILFAPAIALAHGGGGGNGNGNGNGGVGGGMGMGNGGVGVGSINGIGHGVGGAASGIGGSANGHAGMNGNAGANAPERDVDAGPSSDTAIGRLAMARQEARERAAARLAASSNAHGKAVSAEAHLAKSENDGDKVGEDVRAVAHDRSTLPSHTTTHTRTHTRVARTTTSTHTHTHPVNHGAAVSAEAHLAKSENDGDKVGEDVRAVAHDRSTLPTHATTRTKTHARVAGKDTDTDTSTSTKTHPVNHGAAVSAEAHLAKSENDGDTVGEDVRAVAHDKSTLKTHTKVASAKTRTKASTKTHPVNHGAAVSAEAHLAKSENDGDKVGEDVRAVAQDKSTLPTRK